MALDPDELAPTRWSLIHRLKNWDDQTSWGEFFDTYWRLIYSVATKAGLTDAEAQDVVQETILTVAKKIGEFKTDATRGSFKGWLLHTTRWKIADQFRKRPPPKAGLKALESLFRAAKDLGPASARSQEVEGRVQPLTQFWSVRRAGPELEI